MRRVRYHAYGGPEVLTLEEVPPPEPRPGQVRIRVEAIGVNFVDTRFRRGPDAGRLFQRPLPGRPTGDVAGTVTSTGPGADPQLVGRRVAVLAEDAYADVVVADAAWLTPVPEQLTAADATTLAMAGPVALRILRAAPLRAGDTVLVHAAAGGIGHLAVQLARILGAGRIIGTTGAAHKLEFIRTVGADAAVDTTAPDWADQVGPVDVVLDALGGPILRASLGLLSPFGRAVVYGAATGDLDPIPAGDLFALRSVTGFNLTAWRRADPDRARRESDELAALLTAGRLHTAVHATLPLEQAATAHRLIEERAHTGRILLTTCEDR